RGRAAAGSGMGSWAFFRGSGPRTPLRSRCSRWRPGTAVGRSDADAVQVEVWRPVHGQLLNDGLLQARAKFRIRQGLMIGVGDEEDVLDSLAQCGDLGVLQRQVEVEENLAYAS